MCVVLDELLISVWILCMLDGGCLEHPGIFLMSAHYFHMLAKEWKTKGHHEYMSRWPPPPPLKPTSPYLRTRQVHDVSRQLHSSCRFAVLKLLTPRLGFIAVKFQSVKAMSYTRVKIYIFIRLMAKVQQLVYKLVYKCRSGVHSRHRNKLFFTKKTLQMMN